MAVIEQDMIRVNPKPAFAAVLSISEAASQRLQSMMREKELNGYGLRVFVSGGGCSGMQYGMTFDDEMRDGDTEWEAFGLRMLVDPVSARYLRGATIDYQQDNMLAGALRSITPTPLRAVAAATRSAPRMSRRRPSTRDMTKGTPAAAAATAATARGAGCPSAADRPPRRRDICGCSVGALMPGSPLDNLAIRRRATRSAQTG